MGRIADSVGSHLEQEMSGCYLSHCGAILQAEMNTGLADQLAFAGEARRVAEELARARLAECAALKKRVAAAETARAAAERRAAEGELVRRKLHNTILVGAAPAQHVLLIVSDS